jgi:hypothetical protein
VEGEGRSEHTKLKEEDLGTGSLEKADALPFSVWTLPFLDRSPPDTNLDLAGSVPTRPPHLHTTMDPKDAVHAVSDSPEAESKKKKRKTLLFLFGSKESQKDGTRCLA